MRDNKRAAKRVAWIFLGILSVFAVFLAHFMQTYIFIPPCEQCVYIRFAFLVFSFGCFIVAINPRSLILKIVGILIITYAIFRGISFTLILYKIQTALKSDSFAFGVKGCSLAPSFDFNLPLDSWIPSLFKPQAYCGYDAPILPQGVVLSPLQEKLISNFGDGFYLIPSLKIGSLAECAFILFIIFGVAVAYLLLKNCIK
ncbi:MAG: disulfide bond formation protein B [Helicobacter sp.]|nr:disulfide bond formation protein B [Helicobacter sp.]